MRWQVPKLSKLCALLLARPVQPGCCSHAGGQGAQHARLGVEQARACHPHALRGKTPASAPAVRPTSATRWRLPMWQSQGGGGPVSVRARPWRGAAGLASVERGRLAAWARVVSPSSAPSPSTWSLRRPAAVGSCRRRRACPRPPHLAARRPTAPKRRSARCAPNWGHAPAPAPPAPSCPSSLAPCSRGRVKRACCQL